MFVRKLFSRLKSVILPRTPGNHIVLGDGFQLKTIDAHQLQFIQHRFPRKKFFVFGHARSGTTLLARLLKIHPEVHCNWQTQFFSERGPVPYLTSENFHKWLTHRSNRWVSGQDLTAAMLRVSLDLILELEAEKAGKPIVGDKSPNNNGAQAIRWLSCVYPDAQLIYILRDGRDTVLSKRIQAFIDQPQNLSLEDRRILEDLVQDVRPFTEQARSLFSESWLREAASQWGEDVHECVSTARSLYDQRLFEIRYEDLLGSPQDWMERLFQFLNVDSTGGDLSQMILEEMESNPAAEWHEDTGFEFVKHIPRGTHGVWQKAYREEDLTLFESIAGRTLQEFGYDLSSK